MWDADGVHLLYTGDGGAVDINDLGQIIGWQSGPGSVLWDGDQTIVLGLGQARAINNKGQVVGHTSASYWWESTAWVWEDGAMAELDDLIPPDSGWEVYGATDINDLGQIVGWGRNPEGNQQALLLTPIPEPATVGLVGLGLSAIFVRKRRSPGLRRRRSGRRSA